MAEMTINSGELSLSTVAWILGTVVVLGCLIAWIFWKRARRRK